MFIQNNCQAVIEGRTEDVSLVYEIIFSNYISDIEIDLVSLHEQYMCSETCPCANSVSSADSSSA